jgi:hypothetical protein
LTNRVAPAVTLDRDRRRDRRGPVRRAAKVEVVSGLARGESYDVTIRDASLSGSAFYLREALPVGTGVRVVELVDDRPHRTFEGEITRARPITNGRHEMSVRYTHRVDVPELVKTLG